MAMEGRFHFYEGYSMKEVTFPERVMYELGIETLFVSNASGGMNPDFEIGDLMVIDDHINFFPEHPLQGKNFPTGPRFPDMHEAYDKQLRNLADENASTVYGVGDDCAVMHYPDKEVLMTTDMLMEGVHFDLTYIDMQHLGYKSAMVNISDIFAMNGTPRQMVVSIALSKRFKVEDLDDFYKGLRMACDKWGVDIVGGDTTSSLTGLAISITCIGEAAKEDIVYRSGAKETDLICVSGDLGGAYMGLQLLEREKAVYYGQVEDIRKKMAEAKANGDNQKLAALNKDLQEMRNFQPDFAGKEYLLQRQLQPEARGDIMAQLREAGIRPTAMMDISDGLSSELMHICEQSHCGCRVYEKNIPIDYQTAVQAEEFNMNLTTCAMNGGEDYELLFTVPIGDHEKIEAMEGVKQIGYITKESLGKYLITRDGQEFELKAQGWNPLKD